MITLLRSGGNSMPKIGDDDNDDRPVTLAVIYERVKAMDRRMDGFVTKAEFSPVKLITFGIVACILLGVVQALLSRVIQH